MRAFAEPPAIDDAAELLAAAPLHAIAYGFFSSSYVLGVAGDRELQARLEKRTRGIPIVIPGLASLRALRALGVHRLEARKLVRAAWGVTKNGRRARYYELTSAGRAFLRAESERLVDHFDALVTILNTNRA